MNDQLERGIRNLFCNTGELSRDEVTSILLGLLERIQHLEQLRPEPEPVAWRDHVEQRLLTWRQSFVNRSGDQLALDDFMDKQSLDDLVDFVCDEYTTPPQRMATEIDNLKRRLKSVNTAAMRLTSDLTCMEVDDDERLDRDRVMGRVMQWRNEWDKAMFKEKNHD